jgi:hypothetical protein
VWRQDQQEFVMEADGFVDLLVELAASLDIVRGKPAADTFGLEIGMEAVSEVLILGGVTDEAGIKFNS